MTLRSITPRNAEHLTFNVTDTDERGNVSATWIDLTELLAAVERMADTMSDGMTARDAGGHFTCSEADSIADVLRAGGRLDAAEDWLAGHGEGDDEGDSHYREAS